MHSSISWYILFYFFLLSMISVLTIIQKCAIYIYVCICIVHKLMNGELIIHNVSKKSIIDIVLYIKFDMKSDNYFKISKDPFCSVC